MRLNFTWTGASNDNDTASSGDALPSMNSPGRDSSWSAPLRLMAAAMHAVYTRSFARFSPGASQQDVCRCSNTCRAMVWHPREQAPPQFAPAEHNRSPQ